MSTDTIYRYKSRGILRRCTRLLVEALASYGLLVVCGIQNVGGLSTLSFVVVLVGLHWSVGWWRSHHGPDMRLATLIERRSFPGDTVDDWLSNELGGISNAEARRLTRSYQEGYNAAQRDAWRTRSDAGKRAWRERSI